MQCVVPEFTPSGLNTTGSPPCTRADSSCDSEELYYGEELASLRSFLGLDSEEQQASELGGNGEFERVDLDVWMMDDMSLNEQKFSQMV